MKTMTLRRLMFLQTMLDECCKDKPYSSVLSTHLCTELLHLSPTSSSDVYAATNHQHH